MAIIGEDGTGISGAAAYGADPVALTTAYWAERPNDPLAATWAAETATTAIKEGALRSAAAYVEATWGPFFIGHRKTQTQGLSWPRVAGRDEAGDLIPLTDGLGNELPALPPQLIAAQAELAARAVTGPLAEDAERGGRVKSERVDGAIAIEYMDGAPAETSFGVVAGILASLLNGSQPGSTSATWFWR